MTTDLTALFAGARVPRWLQWFETEPLPAIDALLVGGADLGFLSADEPTSVLLDWLNALGERTSFPADIDRTLADWVIRSWGNTTLPQAQGSAALTSAAWVRVGDLLAANQNLTMAAASLRERFLAEPRFLEALHEGRGRDPVARAWQALARHQTDRALVAQWWRLCDLPIDEPWYRGECGVWGLRRLPPETPSSVRGEFSDEAAEGLVRLGASLTMRTAEGLLDEKTAEREFLRIARLLLVAFPLRDSWEAFWRQERDRLPPRGFPETWLLKFLPSAKASPTSRRSLRSPKWTRDPGWRDRALYLADGLRRNLAATLPDAEKLLAEEEAYARRTGDTYPFVGSALRFANALRYNRPELALHWAQLAGEFEPWYINTWIARVYALLRLRRFPESLTVATAAVRRFPDNSVARNCLAEVLKAEKRLAEAEQVYRETIERFPNEVIPRNGLAEVLKAEKRLAEAEQVYRETIERFPEDVDARIGLAEVLKAEKRRLAEVEQVYRETIERFPNSVFAHSGMGELLKAENRLAEAEQVYREAIKRVPNSSVGYAGLAEVLKADKRLAEAEQVYSEAIKRFPRNKMVSNGLKRVQDELAGLPANDMSDFLELANNIALVDSGVIQPPSLVMESETLASELQAPVESCDLQNLETPSEVPNALQAISARVSGTTSTFRVQDATILLTDIYLIRRWARLGGQTRVMIQAADRARDLLVRVRPLIENDAEASCEAGLLEIGLGELDDAVQLLTEAVRRFPGSVRVRFALARAQRELARRHSRRLDSESEQQVIGPWRQLGKMDPRCRPVQLLGEGRAWLALVDGSTVTENARDAFGRLGYWLSKRLQPSDVEPSAQATALERGRLRFKALESVEAVTGWWAREVQAALFGTHAVNSADELADLSSVCANLESRAALFDALEEDGLIRYARA